MGKEKRIVDHIRTLFNDQKLGVFISLRKEYPYPTLVAFYATPDLKTIICATSVNTRKYENVMKNSHVSFILDDCKNDPEDFSTSSVITAFGKASLVAEKDGIEELVAQLKKRHPLIVDFFDAPSTRFITMKVDRYQVITRFQDVREYVP